MIRRARQRKKNHNEDLGKWTLIRHIDGKAFNPFRAEK